MIGNRAASSVSGYVTIRRLRSWPLRVRPATPGSEVARFQPGAMRTGFSEAWLTDVEDDSYDLSWFNAFPTKIGRPSRCFAACWRRTQTRSTGTSNSLKLSLVSTRLGNATRRRSTSSTRFAGAMTPRWTHLCGLCSEVGQRSRCWRLTNRWPIRQQKNHDWEQVAWWAQRGIDLYGDRAARAEAVDDLAKRKERAETKIEAARQPAKTKPPAVARRRRRSMLLSPTRRRRRGRGGPRGSRVSIEVLTCTRCGESFERLRVRGRKPLLCPDCRG